MFRSEDTRHSFTDHLYKALVQAGISTFRDNDEIDRGQDLKPEIEKAITESRAYQRRNFNNFVLPVFYQVDPLDVRNQQQSFAIETKDGAECSIWTKDNVSTWKASLTEVADLSGLVLFSGSETDFIAKVVDTIDCTLDWKLVSTLAHLIGIETRGESITSWLNDEQPSENFLANCGMGGGGKTTLAQHVYNSNKHKFELSSFLQDIGRDHRQPHDLLGLQKQLLTDIIRGKNIRVSNVSEGTSKIEETLQTRKVLIILDDIVENDELAALLGKKGVHTQSKIIITTRRLDIYAWFGSILLEFYNLVNH
uniref:TMV resistance protein N-like n=1 Tax=Tanacetum cinerariifolium TaxID=118510 RepID=A0A699LD62_TANCI|nr:TMV resistance protein N-like [Tanacetum cinerariifolium]